MAEFNIDKMARIVAARAMEGLMDSGAFVAWIPVSERLPEVKGYYLVTGEKYYIPDHVNDIAHYKCVGIGYYSDYLHRFEPSNGIEKFYAWMPLPEPWKGESECRTV